jgi:hypothetical protein
VRSASRERGGGERARRRERPDEVDTGEPAPSSHRVLAIVPVVLIVVVATVAVVVIRSSTPPVLTPRQGADLDGVLMYVAKDGDGWRLWRWHLPTWTIAPGPRLDERPIELLHAREAGEGAVGLTQSGDGAQTARILRHLEESDRASTLLRGDRVAWIRGGSLAVSAEMGGVDERGCGELVVRALEVDRGRAEDVYRATQCGRPTALGTGYGIAYVTLSTGEAWTTVGVLPGRTVFPFPGWGLVAVSRAGGLLLVPTGELPLEGRQPLSRAVGQLTVAGSDLAEPEAYRVDGEPLFIESVLGWASASGGVYIAGAAGEDRGIYLVTIEGGGRPTLLAPLAGEQVALTETSGSSLFVTVDGRFYRVRQGSLQPVEPPPDAPAPDGPILWVPSVPDSA